MREARPKPPARSSLSAYARHRKERGLPGGTLNAVQVARNSGRLDGALTPDRKAIADVELADRLWSANTLANRRPQTGRTAPGDDGEGTSDAPMPEGIPPLAESRARKEAAQAELAERQLARDRGEYLEVAVVRRDMIKESAIIRSRLLAIPSKLAGYLSREEHRRLAPIVKNLIRDSLDELADEDDDVE